MKAMRVATVIKVIGKKRIDRSINQVIVVTVMIMIVTKNHRYLAIVLKVVASNVIVARAVRVVNAVRVRVLVRVRAVRKAQNLERAVHQQFTVHQQCIPQHIQCIFQVIFQVQFISRLR